ncbi:MAG: universal stress protein [Deltaproteobacteria bacterium]
MSVLPADPTRAARAVQLRSATERLPVQERAVMRDEVSAADAILDEAELNGADLVVVGTLQRSWLQRLLSGNVAEQIVNRANCSVLITDQGPPSCARREARPPRAEVPRCAPSSPAPAK